MKCTNQCIKTVKQYFFKNLFLLCLMVFSTGFVRASETPVWSSQTNEVITFDDPVLENYIRGLLKQNSGDINSDLAKLSKRIDFNNLTGVKENITDIGALKYFTEILSLNLTNNTISDLAPIAGLKKLTELELGGNPIRNLSPLSALTNLKKITLFHTHINDLSPLANLSLQEINIGDCPILDITPLNGKQSLTLLWLNFNQYADTAVIKSLVNLKTLAVMSCKLNSLDCTKGLMQLEHLLADRNDISDLSPLKSMYHLTTLSLNKTSVKDLSMLETLYNQGCFRNFAKFSNHISVENCDLDLRPGTNNRRIIDLLVANQVKVAWQKGNRIN